MCVALCGSLLIMPSSARAQTGGSDLAAAMQRINIALDYPGKGSISALYGSVKATVTVQNSSFEYQGGRATMSLAASQEYTRASGEAPKDIQAMNGSMSYPTGTPGDSVTATWTGNQTVATPDDPDWYPAANINASTQVNRIYFDVLGMFHTETATCVLQMPDSAPLTQTETGVFGRVPLYSRAGASPYAIVAADIENNLTLTTRSIQGTLEGGWNGSSTRGSYFVHIWIPINVPYLAYYTLPEMAAMYMLPEQAFAGTLKVEWTLHVDGKLSFVPDTSYKRWLPGQDNGKPRKLTVKVKMEPKNAGDPTPKGAFDLYLHNVSAVPGDCMNWPADNPSTEPDIKFSPDMPGVLIDPLDPTHATTTHDDLSEMDVIVETTDYGAWGELEVRCEAMGLKAKYADTGEELLRIPYDTNKNHIADAWEDDNGVKDKAAKSDEDATPAGDGDPGDGLTIYEEYRGFYVDGKHLRTDPKVKDLFVANELGEDAVSGMQLLEGMSQLKVHGKLTTAELGPDRIINRYNDAPSHVVDQHGLKIVASPVPGMSMARGTGPGTPKTCVQVEICTTLSDWKTVSRGKSKTTTDYKAVIVAHELLHCCNVWHHGQNDLGTRIWRSEEWGGRLQLVEHLATFNAASNRYAVTGGDVGYTVQAFLESGTPMNLSTLRTGIPLWVGSKGGQHSGMEDCLMRYDASEAYVGYDAANRYYPNMNDELPGMFLCSDAVGTGVNAATHKPESRYGNATAGKGNCKGQICVNDKNHVPAP